MFGDKLYNNVGFPTPDTIPIEVATRAFCIPGSAAWLALVMGCLMLLADEENWQVFDGGISAEDAAEAAQAIIDSGYDGTCAVETGDVPTPFWDEITDTDDEATPEAQTWYGYVDDPDLPADELTFIEDVAIWAFTGFLALSGTPAAAILFHTVAEDFVLAMRGDDPVEIIRIVIDAVDYVQIDTTGLEGELIEQVVFPEASETGHDVLIILKEVL
jgi:hypothetical protein